MHDEGCAGELTGAEFDVVAMEDVVSPDGTVRAKPATSSITWPPARTARRPPTSSTWRRHRHLRVRRDEGARGHVLDAAPHEFTLSYADDDTALVEVEVEVADAYTEITIDKDIMGTGHPLAGATFQAWEPAR